jgi:hypothetical protein
MLVDEKRASLYVRFTHLQRRRSFSEAKNFHDANQANEVSEASDVENCGQCADYDNQELETHPPRREVPAGAQSCDLHCSF